MRNLPKISIITPSAPNPEPRSSSPGSNSSLLEPRSSPLISIVTPSFNQGKYLEKTILSVLEQGYPNLEYIIIDGGSTDESVAIIKKYADRLTYWVSEPDRGQSHAINKGFERATGQIFGWLNSDDWYHPGALKAVADSFLTNPQAGAVVGAGVMLYEETGDIVLVEPFPVTVESLYGAVDRFFAQPSCFFKKDAWVECGPLDESLHLAMDLDLWLRIAKKYNFALTSYNFSTSLVHANAKTQELASQSLVDACLVIMRHGGEKEGRARLVAFLQELHASRQELVITTAEIRALQEEQARLLNQIKYISLLRKIIATRENEINAILGSLSWRLTTPIRRIVDVLGNLRNLKAYFMYVAYVAFRIIEKNVVSKNIWLMNLLNRIRHQLKKKNFAATGIAESGKQLLTSNHYNDSGSEICDISISVVIPAKNAGPEFISTLKMIRCQKKIREIEIVVVDSGSDDDTISNAEEYGAKVISIPPEKFTHSYSRNLGAENSTGDYIFFTVQDALLPSDLFLFELYTVYKNNNVTAVSCAEFPKNDTDLFYRVCCKNHYRFMGVDNCDRIFSLPAVQNYLTLRQNGQLSDLACFIGKEDFFAYKYRFEYAEDLDLGVRLIKSGHRLAFLGSLKVIHSHNRPPFYYLKRGYADQIFLTRTFPDYPTRQISAPELAGEICGSFRILSIMMNDRLVELKTPYAPSMLKKLLVRFVAEAEHGAHESARMLEMGMIDERFYDFIVKLSGSYSGEDSVSLHVNDTIVDSFKSMYDLIVDYLIETYDVVDQGVHDQFCQCLFKHFALIAGVNIANGALFDPDGVEEMLAKVSLNIISGV